MILYSISLLSQPFSFDNIINTPLKHLADGAGTVQGRESVCRCLLKVLQQVMCRIFLYLLTEYEKETHL